MTVTTLRPQKTKHTLRSFFPIIDWLPKYKPSWLQLDLVAALTDHLLNQLRDARPGVEIETIEVLKAPGRALREGIFMIPELVVEDQKWFQPPPLLELIEALEE